MIIQLVARQCAPGNSSCVSNNTDTSSPPTTHTPLLTQRNLIGVLVIAALLVAGISLWLCFGKWSKPIRHFFKGESRSSSTTRVTRATSGDGGPRAAVAAPRSVPRRPGGVNAEKVEMMDSSTESTLLDKTNNNRDKVELALPAKAVHWQIKSGSRLAGLVR